LSKKKHRPKNILKKKQNKSNAQKIYFDACALESKIIFKNFYKNHKCGQIFYVSQLGVGEALSNCKNEPQIDSFTQLYKTLIKDYNLKFIENDNCDIVFNNLKKTFNRLSISDCFHLSVAIKNKLNVFITTDSDFNIDSNKFKNFLKGNNYEEIKIKVFNRQTI
jgi:hypothetical protein